MLNFKHTDTQQKTVQIQTLIVISCTYCIYIQLSHQLDLMSQGFEVLYLIIKHKCFLRLIFVHHHQTAIHPWTFR